MRVIKNILGHLYFLYGIVLFIITMLIVFIPIWGISLLKEPTRAKALHSVFKVWMGIYLPLTGCFVKRTGKGHFKKGENYIVITNHNSLVDIPVSSPWIPGPNKTLAKAEMAKVPLFGLIYKTGSILVNRNNQNSRRESFTEMERTLNLGIHLCLYPEGTRNKSELPLQRFYDGAFIAAIKTQRPIIPGILFNTKKILPHEKKFWAKPMTIRFDFLEPIDTKGLTMNDVGELKKKAFDIMEEHYINNQ